jgi:hypothetical protein
MSDAAIIAEERGLFYSPLMRQIRDAHARGMALTIRIGRYRIQYEALSFSGMTAFPDGFVIGKEAFASEEK